MFSGRSLIWKTLKSQGVERGQENVRELQKVGKSVDGLAVSLLDEVEILGKHCSKEIKRLFGTQ